MTANSFGVLSREWKSCITLASLEFENAWGLTMPARQLMFRESEQEWIAKYRRAMDEAAAASAVEEAQRRKFGAGAVAACKRVISAVTENLKHSRPALPAFINPVLAKFAFLKSARLRIAKSSAEIARARIRPATVSRSGVRAEGRLAPKAS
ncbi:MAG TPA: hypothetical protein VND65_08415 [Candidatus Binatia bacterium]|nr:hypothetical protein [Candidatus Binatia bacterium]